MIAVCYSQKLCDKETPHVFFSFFSLRERTYEIDARVAHAFNWYTAELRDGVLLTVSWL